MDGNWKIDMATPLGDRSGEMKLKLESAAITGIMISKAFGNVPIENGKLDGEAATWTVRVSAPFRSRSILNACWKATNWPGT